MVVNSLVNLLPFFFFPLIFKERIRVYMNRVKEITDKKKAGKLDRGAASRFVKNALWEPKPKNASKVANKGKSKN